MHIMVMKYGEKAGKIWINGSNEMEISKSDIFFGSPFNICYRCSNKFMMTDLSTFCLFYLHRIISDIFISRNAVWTVIMCL